MIHQLGHDLRTSQNRIVPRQKPHAEIAGIGVQQNCLRSQNSAADLCAKPSPARSSSGAVADLRAPTPSAAAELAVPDVRQMLQQVQDCSRRLENAMQQQFRQKAQELERLQDRLKLQSPAHRQELAQQELCHLQKRLEAGIRQIWQQCQEQLVQQTNRLDMLSPMKILGRGYALAYHGEELVRSAAQVQSGDVLRVQLAEGEITAKVQ